MGDWGVSHVLAVIYRLNFDGFPVVAEIHKP